MTFNLLNDMFRTAVQQLRSFQPK